MRRRILDVTAYTTLDFADARALGPDWEEDATAVVDVDVPDEESEEQQAVRLSVELDRGVDRLPPHVDRIDLTPAQARELAADLTEYADRLDDE
jgi:hypothetical protein